MSDYGVFEASSTDGYDEEQRQRQATRDLGRAIQAAREGFGDFLGIATDKQDYQDRLALVMNDLMQKVADSGVMPVPGVMRRVKAALRPEFRKAADDGYDSWRADMDKIEKVFDDADAWGDLAPDWALKSREQMIELGEEKGYITSQRKQASVEDIRSYVESKGVSTSDKGNGFTFPTADGAKGYISENRNGDIVVQTLIGGTSGGVQSNYSAGETDLVQDWIDRTAELKQAGPGDGNNMKTEEELSHLFDEGTPEDNFGDGSVEDNFSGEPKDNFKKSRRKHADDYVKGDALNFINHLQNGGYRMPKDAGYPGEGGQMDDELYDYTGGDRNRIDELTRFLQENWDYYAYGASRTAGAGDWEQTHDGADEWVCKRNPRLRILEEDRGYYLFDNITLIEETNTLEQAIELAESHYEGSRKEALEIDGSWEEELPGIGYASCSPKAGGGFELYMWSDSKQSEALDVVSSSEEARRVWQEWRRSDIPSPGNIYDTDYDSFLGNFKHAGGTDFATFAQGASAQEAFENARAEAIQAYGDSGYTGSIAEKDSFEMASRTPMSEEEARKFIWNGNGFGKFEDKWGPAGCIELDTGGFVFFGIAST